MRIPFPRDGDVKTKLVQRAKDAVYAKEGKVFLYRIGLCAADFQVKMANGGISSFFSKSNSPVAAKPISQASAVKSTEGNDNEVNSEAQCQHDEDLDRKLQSQEKANLKSVDAVKVQDESPDTVVAPSSSSADEEVARKLQSQFDRENYVLSMAEKRSTTKPKQPIASKKQRIDNFFRKL